MSRGLDDSLQSYREPVVEKAQRTPRAPQDLAAAWDKLKPITGMNVPGLEAFCAGKGIKVETLADMGTRYKTVTGGATELAWALRDHQGRVTAVKYRRLDDGSRRAEAGSVSVLPMVVGNRQALDWLVAEGETDGARLLELTQHKAAILILPSGAMTWKREWGDIIPRGARIWVCTDADEAGDAGADKIIQHVGGIRVRPAAKDWCDWGGDTDDFRRLLLAARETRPQILRVWTPDEVLTHTPEEPDWLLRDYISPSAIGLVYGAPKAGKTTFLFAALNAMERGEDFIDRKTTASTALILTEQPHVAIRDKLEPGSRHGIVYRHEVNPERTWPEIAAAATELAAEQGHRILVVDSWPRWAGLEGDQENSSNAVIEALNHLNPALAADLAVILIHHSRKSGGKYGENVRGSNALVGYAAVVTEVSRPQDEDSNARKISSVSWFHSTPATLWVELDYVEGKYTVINAPETEWEDDSPAW